MKKIYFLILMLFLASSKLFAVPAYPYPIEITQPDGTTLTIMLKGDEFVSWAETSDGYTLLRNSSGYFEYAQKDVQGDLALSGVIAKSVQQRSTADNVFLQKIPKKLGFSVTQAAAFRQMRQMQQQALDNMSVSQNLPLRSDTVSQPVPSVTGIIRAPLILVQFPGKPFTKMQWHFQLLCNQVGYSLGTATGSVHDYFWAASYNQLDFQVDVYGPYTLAHSIDYYDRNSNGNSNSQTVSIIDEASTLAQANGCNFADYDANNDGYVDGLHLIYAGYDQSAGAPVGSSIWASAWSTSGYFCTRNSKYINRFSMSSELRNTSGTIITPIGVIAHELSHVFGLPDLYDTDYAGSGGQSIHLDKWDIMASGSWNNNGDTPPYHSAWCRDKIGWVPAVELDDPADITLPNPASQGKTYKITTTTPNEYFLLENRQKINWDAYIPASGLLIYHVDENAGTHNSLGWSAINVDPSHRGLYVKQADGGAGSASSIRTTDPYPQSANDYFTDTSVPNAKSWAGNNTNKPVTDIIHNTNARTISFKYRGDVCLQPIEVHAENISADTADIYWTAAGMETSWKLSYKKQSDQNFTELTVTTIPYSLTGLEANTDYDVQVKAICPSGESTACISAFKTLRCDNMFNYTIEMYDSWGDGWNNGSLTIRQNGVDIKNVTISSYSSSGNDNAMLCPCMPFELVWTKGGYDRECSFVIKDNNDLQVFATPDGSSFDIFAGCARYTDGQTVFNGTTNCNGDGIDSATPSNILIYSRHANTIQVVSGDPIHQISVFNLHGWKIYGNAKLNTCEYTITGFVPGIYVVKVASKNELRTTKIIVKVP
jgi:M6 family metalloprotease-like protein